MAKNPPNLPSREPPPEPRPETACTLFELNDKRCRFPLGAENDHPPYMFCGGPTIFGSSYCEHHTIRCWSGGRQAVSYQSLRPRY